MNKIITFFTVLLILSTTMYAGNFEGRMDMQVESAEKGKSQSTQKLVFFIKGVKGLVEIQNESGETQGSMIWDTEKDEIITLVDNDGQKMAMKSTISLWKTLAKSMSGMFASLDYADEGDEFTWEKTSETKTIDGVRSTKYKGTNDEYTMEAWVAESQQMPRNALAPFMQVFPSLESMHGFGTGFVKQSVIKAKDGSSTVTFQNKLSQKSVDDAKFEVPSDYAVMDISRMIEQMQNLDEETSRRFMEQMMRGGR